MSIAIIRLCVRLSLSVCDSVCKIKTKQLKLKLPKSRLWFGDQVAGVRFAPLSSASLVIIHIISTYNITVKH